MTMASGDEDSPPIVPPESRLRRISRDNSNLRLDIESARKLSISESVPDFKDVCQYASPECRTVNNGVVCACDGDVEQEGRELFTNFVREEIQRSPELEEKVNTLTPWPVETPFGYKNPVWAKAGKELREMADAFSKTKERGLVKQRACSMNVLEMTYCQFRDLISEVFIDSGITSQRIVVLFLFCSDLALNSLKQSAVGLFQRCIKWTWDFITEKICSWVKENGGWRVVLSDSVQFIGGKTVVGIFALVGALAAVYHFMKR